MCHLLDADSVFDVWEVHLLYSIPTAPVGSGCTQCNNSTKSGATPNFWVIIETRRRSLDEARMSGLQAAGQVLIIPDLVLVQEP